MEGRPEALRSPRDCPLVAPESAVAELLAWLEPDD
jgi:hypothetical protein